MVRNARDSIGQYGVQLSAYTLPRQRLPEILSIAETLLCCIFR